MLILIQFVTAVIFVFGIVWLVWRMGLGRNIRIDSHAQARMLADEAIPGFTADDIVLDRAGRAALLRDGNGRILVLKKHGAHFAGRLLDSHADMAREQSCLTIIPSDRHFGAVTLDLGPDIPVWAANLRQLEGRIHA